MKKENKMRISKLEGMWMLYKKGKWERERERVPSDRMGSEAPLLQNGNGESQEKEISFLFIVSLAKHRYQSLSHIRMEGV